MQYFIERYDGRYSIDENGVVISYAQNKKGKELKPLLKQGYKVMCLRKDNKNRFIFLHRLLAEKFIPTKPGRGTVNHVDGDKLNNSLSNLEWCTEQENIQHAFRTGLMENSLQTHKTCFLEHYKEIRKTTKLDADRIRELKTIGFTCAELAERFNLSKNNVTDIIRGKTYVA